MAMVIENLHGTVDNAPLAMVRIVEADDGIAENLDEDHVNDGDWQRRMCSGGCGSIMAQFAYSISNYQSHFSCSIFLCNVYKSHDIRHHATNLK